MLRSLFSGISGLRSHQTMMDVTGNNIANVNTAGFKSSQTVFQDTLSQLVRAAGAPQGATGGTNPAQVGLGARVAGISTNFGQGAMQTTGRSTDLMIQGDGFFVVRTGEETLYSRAGAFSFDAEGRLVNPDGAVVQGWAAQNGVVDSGGPASDIRLPVGTLIPPNPTGEIAIGGNLPSDGTAPRPVSMQVFDDQGVARSMSFTYTSTGANSWEADVAVDGAVVGTIALTFDGSGRLSSPGRVAVAAPWGAVTVDVAGTSQFGGAATVEARSQDGAAMGSLQAFTMSPDGTLVGVFSNGLKQPLAQVALANFNNPPGLEKVGGSLYRTTVNSGVAQLGVAGVGGRGMLSSGSLEMSNVDLAQEFTNLIVAQRGFQANSRVITSSDELLQDLVNLKR